MQTLCWILCDFCCWLFNARRDLCSNSCKRATRSPSPKIVSLTSTWSALVPSTSKFSLLCQWEICLGIWCAVCLRATRNRNPMPFLFLKRRKIASRKFWRGNMNLLQMLISMTSIGKNRDPLASSVTLNVNDEILCSFACCCYFTYSFSCSCLWGRTPLEVTRL